MTRNSYSQSYVPLNLQALGRTPTLIEEVNTLRVYNPDGSLNIESTNRDRGKQFQTIRRCQVFNGQPHRKILKEGEGGLLTAYYVPIS